MQKFNRRGVTLIELILVMVVLVLITGLTVTLYPNLRAQGRIVNTIATIDELDKAIRTYEAIEGEFPDSFDSLCVTTGPITSTRSGVGVFLTASTPASIATTLNGGGPGPITDATVISALATVGITEVVDETSAGAPVTSDFGTFETPLVSTTALVSLSAAGVTAYGIIPPVATSAYLVLGIGDDASFIGTTPGISSSPLHESYVESENDYVASYGRYLAIFEIKSTSPGIIDPIRLVKVVSPSALPGGLGGTIENYKAVYDSF